MNQTLRLMGRSTADRVTKDIAREICQRQGVKAFLTGSIGALGTHYVITLEAIHAESGEVIGREQVEAESKEQVLQVLSQGSSRMREKLGESLGSIQKFDAPLELTTSSLEALKAYSLAFEQTGRGRYLDAVPFLKRAVELDPSFAYAYASLAVQYSNARQPGLAAEYAVKAFALRDRVSELEKLRITSFYHAYATGEIDKEIAALQLCKGTFPRDPRAAINLASRYLAAGQEERAETESREALRLDPNRPPAHVNLGDALIRLGRFAEARGVLEHAFQQNLDSTGLHTGLYRIGFVTGDQAAMRRQVDWAAGKTDEYVALDWQAQAAAFAGEWRRARELSRRAVDLAASSNAAEVAAQYTIEQALRAAVLGEHRQAKHDAAQGLALERGAASLARGALALALGGDATQAQSLADELARRYPANTLVHSVWLPLVGAAVELHRNDPGRALGLLEPTRRYETAFEFWPAYLRGESHLRSGAPGEAAAEFRRILEHRGQGPLSLLYPLAHLGLARAAAAAGDAAGSRRACQDLLTLWKGADPDLAVLHSAVAAARRAR
jgi:tetratricopeptide (TPR) repeat protein